MNKKFFGLFVVLISVVLLFSGCAVNSDPQIVNVAALAGPTGMGMSQMIVDGVDCGENVTVNFSVQTAPDQVVAAVINGDYQIAALPTNTAAVIYNKTEGAVVLGAVNTLGTLSIVADAGQNISSIADLKGKTIAATGQGSTPEYVLSYLLDQNGLTAGQDVTIQWYSEHSEAAAQLASGAVAIAMLPEPYATATMVQNSGLVKAIDLTTAWETAAGTKLEMGCVVVNKSWAEANPTVLKKFMKAYQSSVETINKADETAANYVVEAGIMQKTALAQKAIPNCAMTFIKPVDAKKDLNAYYETLAAFDVKAVGGKVPDEGFYAITY